MERQENIMRRWWCCMGAHYLSNHMRWESCAHKWWIDTILLCACACVCVRGLFFFKQSPDRKGFLCRWSAQLEPHCAWSAAISLGVKCIPPHLSFMKASGGYRTELNPTGNTAWENVLCTFRTGCEHSFQNNLGNRLMRQWCRMTVNTTAEHRGRWWITQDSNETSAETLKFCFDSLEFLFPTSQQEDSEKKRLFAVYTQRKWLPPCLSWMFWDASPTKSLFFTSLLVIFGGNTNPPARQFNRASFTALNATLNNFCFHLLRLLSIHTASGQKINFKQCHKTKMPSWPTFIKNAPIIIKSILGGFVMKHSWKKAGLWGCVWHFWTGYKSMGGAVKATRCRLTGFLESLIQSQSCCCNYAHFPWCSALSYCQSCPWLFSPVFTCLLV